MRILVIEDEETLRAQLPPSLLTFERQEFAYLPFDLSRRMIEPHDKQVGLHGRGRPTLAALHWIATVRTAQHRPNSHRRGRHGHDRQPEPPRQQQAGAGHGAEYRGERGDGLRDLAGGCADEPTRRHVEEHEYGKA